MRPGTIVGLSSLLLLAAPIFAGEPNAHQILENTAARYKAMQTYQAEGTVVTDMEMNGEKTHLETSFSIKLKKPNLYLITWAQKDMPAPGMENSGAVWNAGGQPYLYMGIDPRKTYYKVTSDEMAFGSATGPLSGAAYTMPSLFFSGMAPRMPPRLSADLLTNLKTEKSEKVDGEDCYVISGSSGAIKDVKIWVSRQGFLVKQLTYSFESSEGGVAVPEMTDQQLDEAIRGMGQQPTPEARAKMRDMMKKSLETLKNAKMKSISREHYVKISMPELKPADLEFKLPEGATLSDTLFPAMPELPEPDLAGENLLAVKMSEGVWGVGTVRTMLRLYSAKHGGAYPTLAGVKGDALEATLGISAHDLDGKYFKAANFEVTSTPTAYTIKATLGAETYIINQDGVESGTYRTGQYP